MLITHPEGFNHISYTDYYFIVGWTKTFVNSVGVLDSSSNLSDHLPVLVNLSVSLQTHGSCDNDQDFLNESCNYKVTWDAKTKAVYGFLTYDTLYNILLPCLSCTNHTHGCDKDTHCNV